MSLECHWYGRRYGPGDRGGVFDRERHITSVANADTDAF